MNKSIQSYAFMTDKNAARDELVRGPFEKGEDPKYTDNTLNNARKNFA